jgi:hypothetical protein
MHLSENESSFEPLTGTCMPETTVRIWLESYGIENITYNFSLYDIILYCVSDRSHLTFPTVLELATDIIDTEKVCYIHFHKLNASEDNGSIKLVYSGQRAAGVRQDCIGSQGQCSF